MEIPKELEMAFLTNLEAIKYVYVIYSNGEIRSGSVKTAAFMPLIIKLCKQETRMDESSDHQLDFKSAVLVSLLYHSGESKIFQ